MSAIWKKLGLVKISSKVRWHDKRTWMWQTCVLCWFHHQPYVHFDINPLGCLVYFPFETRHLKLCETQRSAVKWPPVPWVRFCHVPDPPLLSHLNPTSSCKSRTEVRGRPLEEHEIRLPSSSSDLEEHMNWWWMDNNALLGGRGRPTFFYGGLLCEFDIEERDWVMWMPWICWKVSMKSPLSLGGPVTTRLGQNLL